MTDFDYLLKCLEESPCKGVSSIGGNIEEAVIFSDILLDTYLERRQGVYFTSGLPYDELKLYADVTKEHYNLNLGVLHYDLESLGANRYYIKDKSSNKWSSYSLVEGIDKFCTYFSKKNRKLKRVDRFLACYNFIYNNFNFVSSPIQYEKLGGVHLRKLGVFGTSYLLQKMLLACGIRTAIDYLEDIRRPVTYVNLWSLRKGGLFSWVLVDLGLDMEKRRKYKSVGLSKDQYEKYMQVKFHLSSIIILTSYIGGGISERKLRKIIDGGSK